MAAAQIPIQMLHDGLITPTKGARLVMYGRGTLTIVAQNNFLCFEVATGRSFSPALDRDGNLVPSTDRNDVKPISGQPEGMGDLEIPNGSIWVKLEKEEEPEE